MRECQERVDSREFAEWLVYRTISPWGPERMDWLLTTLRSTLLGVNGVASNPADMLPWREPDSEAKPASGEGADEFFWRSVTDCAGG